VDVAGGRAVGLCSYLRIDPANGVIEIGHLQFSPRLQRTPAATEAMYLLIRRAIDELGYRRMEWKCDSLNAPSRAAAERLGFRFEGVFRQAVVYKGRNRDTAWFSIVDAEWPARRAACERWLDAANFDAQGRQIARLAALRAGGA
jgi:RimJ/RimL family protein N-acetyltransferase